MTVGCPPAALQENAARLDAIMLAAVPDSYTLRGMLRDERITSVTLGPGLGLPPALLSAPPPCWPFTEGQPWQTCSREP